MGKKGVILLNLGTPDSTSIRDIRRYLNEFLSDPRVIDLSAIARFILVKFLILPFRPRKIKPLYEKVWTKNGSPLLFHTKNISEALQKKISNDFEVKFAMRYGSPSMESLLPFIAKCDEILVLPLYPQYATSSTGTALSKLYKLLEGQWDTPKLSVIHSFYTDPLFIKPVVESIKKQDQKWDHLLFSYHGVPERHLLKSSCKTVQSTCASVPCPDKSSDAAYCYRYQCYQTTKKITESLELNKNKFSVSFQSRLGRTPWIKPYTDMHLPLLYEKGVRNLAVVSPSFIADCLETIEEIGIRLRDQWLALEGTTFHAIPCLNDDPLWVDNLSEMIKKSI